jgi:hypothetical protein
MYFKENNLENVKWIRVVQNRLYKEPRHLLGTGAQRTQDKVRTFKIKMNNSVPTSKKTHGVSITKITWLILFKEIISIYYEYHTKRINTKCKVTDC